MIKVLIFYVYAFPSDKTKLFYTCPFYLTKSDYSQAKIYPCGACIQTLVIYKTSSFFVYIILIFLC